MKKTTKSNFVLIFISIFLAIVALIIFFRFNVNEPDIQFHANNIYDKTLIVVADKDFPPYSFFDENNNPTGHDIEMIYLLADSMEMNVEIHLMERSKAIEALTNKEADILLGVTYNSKELKTFQLSMPIFRDFFVIYGKMDFDSLSTLYEKKIATLKGGQGVAGFIIPHRLDKNTTLYDTYEDAFLSVLYGKNDYVFAKYSIGSKIVPQYLGIKPFGAALYSNAFCVAVGAGNLDLVHKINIAIIETRKDRTLNGISDKWLGRYVEIRGVVDFFMQHKLMFILILCATIFIPLLALIYLYKARYNYIYSELNAARDIQMGILPPIDVAYEHHGYVASAFLEPAREVGGDLYDFFIGPDGREVVVIGDVSGKGIPAALFMSMTVTLVRYAIASDLTPAEAMYRINNLLCENNPSCMFVTLFIGIFDPKTGIFDYANGGHCVPYLVPSDGSKIKTLDHMSGPLVGVMPNVPYSLGQAHLAVNELCLIYTDGVSEAMNEADELFGEERICKILEKSTGKTPHNILNTIYQALLKYRGDAVQSDDITMLCFVNTGKDI